MTEATPTLPSILLLMDPRISQILSLVKKHPFISSLFLLLFTPPFFPLLRFFSPLLLSTALCALAFVSFTAHFAPPPPPPPRPPASLSINGKPSSPPSPPPLPPLTGSPAVTSHAHDIAHDESLQTVVNVCREEVTWLEWFFHHGHQEPSLKACAPDHPDGARAEGETEEHDEFHMHFITEESTAEGVQCRREEDLLASNVGAKICPSTPLPSEKVAQVSQAEEPDKEAESSKSEEPEKEEEDCVRERAQSEVQQEKEAKTSLRFSFFPNGILDASASARHTSVAAKSGDDTEVGADLLASNGSGLV